jgi:hypothetical protein
MPTKLFVCSTILGSLDVDKAAQDWLSYKSGPNIRHLLSFKFLFDTRAMTMLVRTCHHILMRHAYNAADSILQLRRKTMPQLHMQDIVYLDRRLRAAQDHYIVLKINRQSVLPDAFDQLWHRERRELLRPLRIRMGIDEGEIGHDLGGVQIEFFKLVCQEAFDPAYCMSKLSCRLGLMLTQYSTLLRRPSNSSGLVPACDDGTTLQIPAVRCTFRFGHLQWYHPTGFVPFGLLQETAFPNA